MNKNQILKGARILVVDDEEPIRAFLRIALTKRGCEVTVRSNGREALELFDENSTDLIITDLRMPEVDGMEILRSIYGSSPSIPVIMLTAHGSIENAVEAMRVGAFDYLTKPITDLAELDIVIARALHHRHLLVENLSLRGKLSSKQKFDRIIASSEPMQRIFDILSTVAPTQTTVLVQGASGTGKELIARAIHENSPRANRPLIEVNCAALPENLIESELFGHEKGSFTGAIRTTRGKFEAANGGTLLLDEIGDMPVGLQAKLLRVIQERRFQRIGSNESTNVDFRLIATTNVNLEKAVENGEFRQDLFYRLNVIPITLPPLCERREDISVLAYHFLRYFAKLHDRKAERISQEALRFLYQAPWQGNVRELENLIERAVVLCPGEEIELHNFFITDIPPQLVREAPPVMQPTANQDGLALAEVEKRHILSTLESQNNHRARTADVLGISIRTLRNKLNEYRQDS